MVSISEAKFVGILDFAICDLFSRIPSLSRYLSSPVRNDSVENE